MSYKPFPIKMEVEIDIEKLLDSIESLDKYPADTQVLRELVVRGIDRLVNEHDVEIATPLLCWVNDLRTKKL